VCGTRPWLAPVSATTLGPQQCPTPPHGRVRSRHVSREGDILQGINSKSGPHGRAPDPWIYSPDLQGWSRTSMCASQTPGMGSRPPTMGSQGSRIEHTWAWNKAQAGVWCQHVSRPGPICIHSCSPLRWRPDAATWTTARDVSQRMELGVRPLGYIAPAFIADKTSACPF
jgi:hypothetical protein